MTFRIFLQFVAVVAVLAVMAFVWSELHLEVFDVLTLAVLLALADWVVSGLLGRSFSAQYTGLLGWLSGVAILYGVSWLLPGVHMSVAAALTAGTALWLIGHILPSVYG